MQQITVGTTIGKALSTVAGQVILCDGKGRALGLFSPLPAECTTEDLQLEPPLSVAETDELRKHRTGKPLEEVLKRLGIE